MVHEYRSRFEIVDKGWVIDKNQSSVFYTHCSCSSGHHIVRPTLQAVERFIIGCCAVSYNCVHRPQWWKFYEAAQCRQTKATLPCSRHCLIFLFCPHIHMILYILLSFHLLTLLCPFPYQWHRAAWFSSFTRLYILPSAHHGLKMDDFHT